MRNAEFDEVYNAEIVLRNDFSPSLFRILYLVKFRIPQTPLYSYPMRPLDAAGHYAPCIANSLCLGKFVYTLKDSPGRSLFGRR